jgi:murein DD-endopeptidase MepM/ murein hydrolase activator NlpD
MHEGIDIAISAGNPIIAAAPGVVTHAGWMGGYGNMVIVQHAGNLATGYAHQSQISVSAGQLVQQGQVLGLVGCTGHCFGDHLHFEVYVDGAPNDPMRFLT